MCINSLFYNFIVLLIIDFSLMRTSIWALIAAVLCLICMMSSKKDFVIFEDEEIKIINGGKETYNFKNKDIVLIYIPNIKTRKNKLMMSPIVFVLENKKQYIISWSKEIEEYITKNFENTKFYSKYSETN